MKLFAYFAFLVTVFQLVLAEDATTTTSTSTSSSATSTLVWATGTNSLGKTTVTELLFTQSFMTTYTAAVVSWSSGSVGMGSLSGSVGAVREYSLTTISQGNGNSLVRVGSGFTNPAGLWISAAISFTLVLAICI